MRRILLLIGVVLLSSCSHSVMVSNNAPNVPDSVKDWLTEQSQIIGFYAAVQQDSNYLDTAILPHWAATRVYNAIAALWRDTNLKERDTVFDVYALKERGYNDFHSVILNFYDGTGWDSIRLRYGFSRDTTLGLRLYRSPLLLNIIGVARDINEALGFPRQGYPVCAEPNAFGGEGDHVKATFGLSSTMLDYSVGYGDCPSGCMARRHWKFQVYDDGRIQYLGSSGDPPPTQEMRR